MMIAEISPRDSMPVGYRFHPSDQEIIGHFLKNKILGNEHLVGAIPEVDICQHEPWELPYFSVVKSHDPEWFFFSTLDLKLCDGGRLKRKAKNGFWKPTGKDQKIKARGTNILIGTKKTLVFHRGRVCDAVRTKWMIYEYHSVNNQSRKQPIYVVCRLMKKDDKKVEDENPDYGSQSRPSESDVPEANEALKYSPNNHPKKKEIVMRPPAEYFANFVIGIFLIIAFAGEMVMYGQWRM